MTLAEGLAQAGAAIVINGRQATSLSSAVAAFRMQGHTVHEALFDVTNEKAIQDAFSRLDDADIEIDILVNNAGIQLRKPILDLQLSEWQRVIDTNLTSAFLVGREAARRMIKRGRGGKIINIASLTSEVARPTTGPYTTAKGGLKLLTRAMTAEWAEHGIQVNALAPGYIVTEMNKALTESPSFDAWVLQRTPARRWGAPADLVGTAVYLASPASDFVSGQIIFVDGGIMAVL
jgi:gluconate 5-dehydrogenase